MKLFYVGTLATVVFIAIISAWAIQQLARAVHAKVNGVGVQTTDREISNGVRVPEIAKGTLSRSDGNELILVTEGQTRPLRVDADTAIYIQGETVYRTEQGDAAVEACAGEHCPVYVVWATQPGRVKVMVIALSATQQAEFPDPDLSNKTPIPWPSATPPRTRIPTDVPTPPLRIRSAPTSSRN
jgi:hypothetical protein